jgi:hypothetical protein
VTGDDLLQKAGLTPGGAALLEKAGAPSSVATAASPEEGGLLRALKAGVTRGTGADLARMVDPSGAPAQDTYEPQGFWEKQAEGLGELAGSPYIEGAGLIGSGLGPVGGAIGLGLGLGAEGVHQALKRYPLGERAQHLVQALKEGAVDAGIGLATGGAGAVAGKVPGTLGKFIAPTAAEALTMSGGNEAKRAAFGEPTEPDSTPLSRISEGAIQAAPLFGAFRLLHNARADAPEETPQTVNQTAQQVVQQDTGPTEEPVNEPGKIAPGVGAGSTPPATAAERLSRIQSLSDVMQGRGGRAAEVAQTLREPPSEPPPLQMPPPPEAATPPPPQPAPPVPEPAPETPPPAEPAVPPPPPPNPRQVQLDGLEQARQAGEAQLTKEPNKKRRAQIQKELAKIAETRATLLEPVETAPEGTPGTPVAGLAGMTIAGPGEAAPTQTPTPDATGAAESTLAPNTGTPEAVPTPKGPGDVRMTGKLGEQHDKLLQQADGFRAEAQKATDPAEAQRLHDAADRAAQAAGKVAHQAEGAPPGEPDAGAPEAPPPPETEPPPPEPAAPPEEAPPPVPPEPQETRVSRLLRALREVPQEPQRPARPTEDILQAARAPIPPSPEEGPIRGGYPTRDDLAEALRREHQAAQQTARGEPVTVPWTDAKATPEERASRMQELVGRLRERQALPFQVDDVVSGKRGLYVQETGTSPVSLAGLADQYSMGYAKVGPLEVFYNPDAVSEAEVQHLAQVGELPKLVEPDADWSRTKPGGPSERGALGPFKRRPEAPDYRASTPALEARHVERGPTQTWRERWNAIVERPRHAWNQFFGFEDEVRPRHFQHDPWLRDAYESGAFQQHIEDLENSRIWAGEAERKATAQMAETFGPVAHAPNYHENFELLRRVIDFRDLKADTARGIDLPPGVTKEALNKDIADLEAKAPKETLQSLSRYRAMMRKVLEVDVGRGWIPREVLKFDDYFPRWTNGLADAAMNLYQGLSRGLGEMASTRWQRQRTGGLDEPLTGEDFLQAIRGRLMAHDIMQRVDEFYETNAKRFDILPHMTPAERAKAFQGATTDADVQAALADQVGSRIVLRGPDGKARAYYVSTNPGPRRWGYPPGSETETALLDFYGSQRLATKGEVHLVPAEIGQRWEQFTRPQSVLQLSRDLSVVSRAQKRVLTLVPGFRFFYRNFASDAWDFWRDAGVQEGVEMARLAGQFSKWVASGGTSELPDVVQAYLRQVPESNPRLKEFQDLIAEQGVAQSGFLGDPQVRKTEARLEDMARGKRTALENIGRAVAKPGKQLLESYDILSQGREALLRVLKAKAEFERMKAGKPITSWSVDLTGLTPRYRVGATAKAMAGNYTRVSPAFQRQFREFFAWFATWPKEAIRNNWNWHKNIGTAMLSGNPKAAAEWVIKEGLPLYLAYKAQQRSDQWQDLKKRGAWMTDSYLAFPLQTPDADGNLQVFVPSTSFDATTAAFNIPDLIKHTKNWADGKMSTEDWLTTALTDRFAGIGDLAASYASQYVDIPYGMLTNTDVRNGGRKIVDQSSDDPNSPFYGREFTPGGWREKAVWALNNFLAAPAAIQRGVEKGIREPGHEATGPFARTIESLLAGPLDPNPLHTFIYSQDTTTLPLDAAHEQGKEARKNNADIMANFQNAVVAAAGKGDQGPLQQVLAAIKDRASKGVLPPDASDFQDVLKEPSFMRRLLEAKNMAATTPEQREESRQTIKAILAAAKAKSFQSFAERHPSAAAQGLLEVLRNRHQPIATSPNQP